MTEHRPPGRRRYLSDQEIDLWLHITRDVSMLPGRTLPEKSEPRGAAEPAAPAARPPARAPVAPVQAKRPGPPPLTALDRRLRQRIARGRVEIEAAIDLHGMYQAQAHAALIGFLARAQSEGEKLVLVVTGKGKSGLIDPAGREREAGVLRRLVPQWLHAPDLRRIIVGFEEAAPAHGGAGALYVRLRRLQRGGAG